MSFVPESYAIGSHAFLLREGDTFSIAAAGSNAANPVSSSNVPATSTPEWIDLGTIEEWEDKITSEEKKTYRPSPGALVTKDVITTKQDLEFTFKSNVLTVIAQQLLYRTQTLAAGAGFYNPLSGVPPRGFLLLQRYDQYNVLHQVALLWVRIKVNGGFKSGDGNLIMPEFTANLLYNTNNIVTLS